MKKRIVLSVALLMIMILVLGVSIVSAGVYFSQPESIYNLGDIINMTVDINPVQEGPLKIDIFCSSNSDIVAYEAVPSEQTSFQLPLTSAYIGDLTGNCYFTAEYAGNSYNSRDFKISNKLNVQLDSDSYFTNPGDEITISGSVKRLNGMGINGEIEISIPLLSLMNTPEDKEETSNSTLDENDEDEDDGATNETDEDDEDDEESNETVEDLVDNGLFYGQVVDGVFSITFSLSENTPAGDYRLDVLSYEELDGQRTSEGIGTANLNIFQILTNIDIALSNQNADPGTAFDFRPLLTDQAENPIEDEVTIMIKSEELETIFESLVQSGETISYDIPTNMSAGYYTISVSKDDLNFENKFYVNEKEIVSLELINETLVVTNIGNIFFNDDIQIELDGKPFVRRVQLDLGESTEFKLTGSNAEYDIKITAEGTELSQNRVMLTGHAVSVDEIGNGSLAALGSPIVWIFFIIILGAGLLFLFRNVLKKKSFAYPFKRKEPRDKVVRLDKDGNIIKEKTVEKDIKQVAPKVATKTDTKEVKTEKVEDVKAGKAPAVIAPKEAEQVLVLKGHKNKAAVIILKIKNKLDKTARQSLERAMQPAYAKGGAVYEQGDYVFIIFSPIMTKTFKGEVEAAKVAQKIHGILNTHNKKFKEKIDFGISINSGNIINKIENKKLKFTALGNLISSGKRLAEASDKQILVTKQAYERGITEIKASKIKIGDGEVYELKRVVDSEKNQVFIKGFLERQKKEAK